MRRKIRLSESKLHRIIKESVNKILRESFEDDYNRSRSEYKRPLWGFEMKNPDGDWQYGEIEYNPSTQTMSCMGVSINVDPSQSVDYNLEGLYDELVAQGYTDGDNEYE